MAIILLVVAVLCLVAVFRELKAKNFFAVGFAGISTLVFGWFSIMTILSELNII
ncbi:putative membrane protein [Aquibacillus albus]|uniref:Membrane protein n=1 Tax=Aquibacillus albus TaxID=1168171 RepID=A0ABS2MUW9_9BACI|nr:putative membrane protein [Aquibacillus albus]